MTPNRASNLPPVSDGEPGRTAPTDPLDPAQHSLIQVKRFFIRFAIAATAATFIAMLGMLYYSWWRRPVGATALIVVVGDESFSGANVRVEGATPPAVTRVLAPDNQYTCRIPVVPGTYSLEVIQHGRTLNRQDLVRIREHDLAHLDLRKIPHGSPPSPPTVPEPTTGRE